jgi:glycerate 2-kinase
VNILVCPDKFKGSLSARHVCDAVAQGIREVYPGAHVETVPLADGGEGTCALLTEASEGRRITIQVTGPLFTKVTAHYGISKDCTTAFIEMAEASGLTLLMPEERNPLMTTSLGTGEMILDAIGRGVKNIILGLGGSATTDGGIGMAAALGYHFCDAGGEILKPIGENLIHIHHLRADCVNPALAEVSVIALCDVTNPLYGPEGAAFVYGPQKGADEDAVKLLDAGLRNFRRVIHKHLKISVDFPGAGAAGGLGAGARVFLNASMKKGVNYIIENSGLNEKMAQADLVITGEGKIDNQTFSGKVVSEIINLADSAGKPVIAICGTSEVPEEEAKVRGLRKVISLVDEQTSQKSAIEHAATLTTLRIAQELKKLGQL